MLATYPVKAIADDIYEINEFDGVSMFLVVGSERALLVDTGDGIGDIKSFVSTITDKPIDVVITHNHRDHAGNAPRFETIHMSALDKAIGPIIRPWTSAASRLVFARRTLKMFPDREYPWVESDIEDFFMDREPKVNVVDDGYVFDLGDRKETVRLCPGHTPGSLVVIDDKTGILFSGDCCNGTTGLGVRPLENPAMRHVSVEQAYRALKHLSSLNFDKKRVFCAHSSVLRPFGRPLPEATMGQVLDAMRFVLDGGYKEAKTEFIPVLGLSVNSIVYNGILLQFHKDNVFDDKKKEVGN